MVRYLDDYEEQCKRCKGECGVEGMSGSIVCHGFVAKTNADRIRSLSDEELATVLYLLRLDALQLEGFEGTIETKEEVLEWLREEADDERTPTS